ncbi:MAG: short-chain dehydrogenase [Herminiimonas sp.]|nr:short-chain dehydrogenase [Herminiimonas sp.]
MTEPRAIIAVTGGNRGIGAAIVSRLLQRGHTVALLSREGRVPVGQDLLPAAHGRLFAYACDITAAGSARQAFARIAADGFRLAGLVNNAGIHMEGPSDSFTSADFDMVLLTNASGTFATCREAFPHLAVDGGLIINIGSFFDRLGVKGNAAYCASKAAIGAITRCLAVEWAAQGIRVLDVAPGPIETDLNRAALKEGGLGRYLAKRNPTGGAGQPEHVARLVGSLFDADSAFLTGETIYIDGGQGIAH